MLLEYRCDTHVANLIDLKKPLEREREEREREREGGREGEKER